MKKPIKNIVTIIAFLAIGIIGYLIFLPQKPELFRYHIDWKEKEEGVWCVKVAGMRNKLVQDKMNRAIQTDWILWLEDYLESPLEVSANLDGYFILDQYLCITGEFDNYGTRGGGKKYYCAVYDLKNGERVFWMIYLSLVMSLYKPLNNTVKHGNVIWERSW